MEMDPEQKRGQIRSVLRAIGADLTLFDDSDLDIMWEARYRRVRGLQSASQLNLRAAGLKPGLVDHILWLQAAAAGLGTGSAAEAGPPACKLQLRQDLQNQDLFFLEPKGTTAAAASPGVSRRFFLDPQGRQIHELLDWLCVVDYLYREGKPILPLFINGPVKTGKTYVLNEVLPAVANTYYGSGGSGRQHTGIVLAEPIFLRVNCLGFCRIRGNVGFLLDLLTKLKASAAKQQLFDAASTPMPIPTECSEATVAVAIQNFMWRLPRDRVTFLLIDEVQSFYLMEQPGPSGTTLDVTEVQYMRRIFKELLLDSPHWVAWAVTGSLMATVWANVAATPTNGFALIMHNRRLDLSPTVPMGVLQVAWEQLKVEAATGNRALPDDLVWRSRPQIATLAYLCEEWSLSRTANTAAELVEQTITRELVPEVVADLRMVLQVLGRPGSSQLRLLRELLDPLAGVERGKLLVPFEALLASFATEREGRLYLDYPLFAQVLQAATSESGELLDMDTLNSVPAISSRMFRELFTLGECCKDSENFDSFKDLHSLLEDMASALALTPDGLLKADWFVQVLDHCRNSRGAKDNFVRNYGAQAQLDVKVGLRWFHGLQRNVLGHGSIAEQRQVLQDYPSKLADFCSSGRVSDVLTKTFECPLPSRRNKAPGATAAGQRLQQAAVGAQGRRRRWSIRGGSGTWLAI